ncbi:thiamine transport system substrate-binding protein [Tessaracoccus bendigoensis DSM 12906]|uniref:Thiamine transport system substrate-binding protein n=1 Tax=Tessaracoccus bendigoensis DSM 12906 TaxID=1123357 RepID=A0A1M6I0R7_9ACTN|nr:thiamine ABC transporter substrate-binding protein [Tessaracoccus bendigoensis]SHJ28089.1 thiamine transport system substrate-binding protein [Tessaracoccus bendigoensis DSM 12906]
MQRMIVAGLTAVALLALSACGGAPSSGEAGAPSPTQTDKLTVVTHDAFTLPDELKAKFADETGLEVTYVAPGDTGTLVNQLVLTKDSPLGDVVYGIDNTFASRAASEGVLVDYESPLAASTQEFAAPQLTPIDFGDVCINADTAWFEAAGIEIPSTLDDLTDPVYKDLLVVTNPASSAPGLSFLLATIGAKGEDGYLDYWQALSDNGTKVASGWTEAYYTDFSGADGKGPRPLVLSYSTSPAYTVDGDTSTTQALLGTCFRAVEYAGVLHGTTNEAGAQKFIDFMLSPEVQAAIPENLYMYPVIADTPLPKDWARFAPLSEVPFEVPAEQIGQHRDQWIRDWTEAIG